MDFWQARTVTARWWWHSKLIGSHAAADNKNSAHEVMKTRQFINTPVKRFAKLVSFTVHGDCRGAPCFELLSGVSAEGWT